MIGRTRLRPAIGDGAGRAPGPAEDGGSSAAGGPGVAIALSVEVDGDEDEDVDGPRWARLASLVLNLEGVAPGAEAGLSFVSSAAMAALNAAHVGHDSPTDVLAFPIDGLLASGSAASSAPPGMVGDIVICPAVAAAGAADHAGSVDDEIALLVVHGALHLLGHDHAEDAERARMQARERELLAALHGPLAADPWSDG